MELKDHVSRLEEQHYALRSALNASAEASDKHPINFLHPDVFRTNGGLAREIGKTSLEFVRLIPHVHEMYLIHKGKLPKIE